MFGPKRKQPDGAPSGEGRQVNCQNRQADRVIGLCALKPPPATSFAAMKAATSLLLFAVLSLVVLGIVTLVSASTGQQEARYLVMQPIWAGVGLVALGAAAWFDYRWFRKFWWVLLLVAVGLLALVWVPGIGITKKGAARWIGYGGLRLQPSE